MCLDLARKEEVAAMLFFEEVDAAVWETLLATLLRPAFVPLVPYLLVFRGLLEAILVPNLHLLLHSDGEVGCVNRNCETAQAKIGMDTRIEVSKCTFPYVS